MKNTPHTAHRFPLSAFLLVLLFLMSIGCSKNDGLPLETISQISLEKNGTSQINEYYLDSVKVPEGTFALDDSSIFLHITSELFDDKADVGLIKFWAFTTQERYYAFGNEHNIPLREVTEMAEHLHFVADSAGIITHFETDSTFVIPQWYLDYCKDYHDLVVNGFLGGVEFRTPLMLFKKCQDGTGGLPWAGGPLPIMPPTWNNKVSRHFDIGLYSLFSVFDNYVFSGHLFTFSNWGFNSVCWENTVLDNRMTSGINY